TSVSCGNYRQNPSWRLALCASARSSSPLRGTRTVRLADAAGCRLLAMHDHPDLSTPAAGTDVSAELPEFIEQDYARYDREAHDVWRILYERRMATLRETASHVYLDGAERIGLASDCVPDLADVNRRLAARTGWAAVGVQGFIPAAQFFRCLSKRRFP